MRRLSALAMTTLVAACSGEPANQLTAICENAVKESIRTPASYRQVELEELPSARAAKVIFDAENGFGALVRAVALCQFDHEAGIEAILLDGDKVNVPSHLRSKWTPLAVQRQQLQEAFANQ